MTETTNLLENCLIGAEVNLNLSRSRLTQKDFSVALDYLQTTIEQLKALEITLRTIVQNERQRGSE